MTTAPALAWLSAARSKLGIREVAGSKHDPTILGWLKLLGAWWSNDEEPWCGAFVAICLREAGLPIIAHWYRARAWAEWGVATTPRVGALLVFGRDGGGHVGWYLGQALRPVDGRTILCFRVRGGNQSNMVCDAWIPAGRLIGSRWPAGVPVSTDPVTLTATGGAVSTNEA